VGYSENNSGGSDEKFCLIFGSLVGFRVKYSWGKWKKLCLIRSIKTSDCILASVPDFPVSCLLYGGV